jgi:cytosine/adenosine deaminase-related metal-dependent hydrolase
MNNHVGYARPWRFGARVMLGTDGIGADLFAEAQAAFFAARAAGGAFDPVAALAHAQSFAAGAFDAGIGRFDAGCPADLVVLDRPAPTPVEPHNLLGHFVFGLSAAAVRDVFVAGRPVMVARRLLGIDEHELAARAREAAPRLWRRMATI